MNNSKGNKYLWLGVLVILAVVGITAQAAFAGQNDLEDIYYFANPSVPTVSHEVENAPSYLENDLSGFKNGELDMDGTMAEEANKARFALDESGEYVRYTSKQLNFYNQHKTEGVSIDDFYNNGRNRAEYLNTAGHSDDPLPKGGINTDANGNLVPRQKYFDVGNDRYNPWPTVSWYER